MIDEKKSNVLNDTVSKIKDAVTSDTVKNAAGAVKDAITSDKVKNTFSNIASSIKSKKTAEGPAIVKCPACQHDVSNTALKCPNCGHQLRKPQRTMFGKIIKWTFIGFNVLMILWFISIGGSDAHDASKGLASMLLLPMWVMGDIILGLFVLFTRPKG